jgi:hypothetical protein
MIKFSIGGRTVDPRNMKDALMATALDEIRAQIAEKVGAIRDPDTGEFPTIIVSGDDTENLKLHIEGRPALIAKVRERLGMDEENGAPTGAPHVFLSYTSDDLELAHRVAEALEVKGIRTWWDKWCIYPGDSLRHKIDEGLSECTHFLVLLTPQSIGKPWVNQEMDAGLVRKLKGQCRFLAVRYDLPASALPPLLSGMHSPEIATDEDVAQLISDIYGVIRRPPRGEPPALVSADTNSDTGYSAAASAVARYFVENSKHGTFADPQIDVKDLAQKVDLSLDDTSDALFELSGLVKVSLDRVLVKGTLFAEFDRCWKPWNPASDALKLGADILNDPDFPSDCTQIADRYGWEPRRLNPVIYYMLERHLIVEYQALGTQPWAIVRIVGNDHLRRFVKSHS